MKATFFILALVCVASSRNEGKDVSGCVSLCLAISETIL